MSTEASPPTAVTRHHVGPLLTVFEPHSLCGKPTILSTTVQLETKSRYAVEYGETMGAWAPRDPNASLPCPVVSEIQCMPSSVSHNAPKAFYSPGLWCPSGWYTAARIVASKTDKLGLDRGIIRSTLLPDETVNICCPSYYSFSPDTNRPPNQDCVSTGYSFSQSNGDWPCRSGTRPFPQSTASYDETVYYTTTVVNGLSTQIPIVIGSFLTYAPTIQLNYRAEDVGIVATAVPSSEPASMETTRSTVSGFGGGVIAGIVVGAVVAFFVLCAAAVFVFIHSRKRAKKAGAKKAEQMDEVDGSWCKPELDNETCARPSNVRPELEICQRYELEGSICWSPAQELHVDSPMSELPGDDEKRDIKCPSERAWSW